MRNFTVLRTGCVACCVAVIALGAGAQQHFTAHVLEVKGEWHLAGKTGPVVAGDGLNPGAKITAGSDKQDHSITIVHDEDLSRLRISCDDSASNPCRDAIVVEGGSTAEASTGSQIKSLVQAAISLLLNKPPAITNHYALTLTRGGTSVREFEEVVPVSAVRGLVLPSAPTDMAAGRYMLSIAKAGDKSSATQQTGVLTSAGSWMPLPVHDTGSYEISITNEDGDQLVDEMVLLVPEADYPKTRAGFDVMKSRTANWSGPGARGDEHLFLRAYLLSVTPT